MVNIKPYCYRERITDIPPGVHIGRLPFQDRERIFFRNGKAAITFLISSLGLTRDDEVCILTSTDSNYVSTCVSATIFNYCRLSRIITEQTKLIYVIHEFGLPHPSIFDLAELANNRGIPLVEDCAHTMDSCINNVPVGSIGDYAIYSLTKHFPMKEGGLLTIKSEQKAQLLPVEKERAMSIESELEMHLPYLSFLSRIRRNNFTSIRQNVQSADLVYDIDGQITPYLFILKSPHWQELYSATSDLVEPHPVHVPGWFAVSTQPFMTALEIANLSQTIKKVHDQN